MSRSHTNPETPGSTGPEQTTDEHGRLKREEIADILDSVGATLDDGDYFPYNRGEAIRTNCENLATALRAEENVDIVGPTAQLLNTTTEALGDVERLPLQYSTEVLELLGYLQAALVEALSHAGRSSPAE